MKEPEHTEARMEISKGLAGVIADTTAISEIDGEKGELRYRGYPIEDIVKNASFAQCVGLVVDGEIPAPGALAAIVRALADNRALPVHASAMLAAMPRDTHPMTVLQTLVPVLGPGGARTREQLFALGSKIPTAVAAWARLRAGKPPLAPDPALPLHADFLRMLRGEQAAPDDIATLDATQMLQMEHGFNASTFAGRTVASTGASLPAVLSAGVGALSGPLHGGADEAAWRMALEIGTSERAAAWVDAKLEKKEKIPGLGHREYRVVDPRAVVLRPMALALGQARGLGGPVGALVAVDDHAEKRFAAQGKRIRANVEFYKGAVFAALGLPPEFFTTLFVMGRVWGWGAHALELGGDSKLYRPAAQYVGSPPRRWPVRG
jgi:citrate synthase